MSERVNHPEHYNSHPSGVEAIEVCEGMNFCLGNVLKYLWRMDHKGSKVEDIKKAIWYASREVEYRKKMKADPLAEDVPLGKMRFVVTQEPSKVRQEVFNLVWSAAAGSNPLETKDLEKLINLLNLVVSSDELR